MEKKYKTVRDPIHGDIIVKGYEKQLLQSPEIQRLHNIKQLGLAHLVFPGAQHTRLEHSLGAFFVAKKIASHLELDKQESDVICCAALLHDLGHGPFSHTLESLLMEKMGINHVDVTEELLYGKREVFDEKEKDIVKFPRACEVLKDNGIDIDEVVSIIKGRMYKKSYLSQMMNSTIDVDQLDYLLRDAYYTGVAYGLVDIRRLVSTLMLKNGCLTIERKGVSVVENVLVARALMYSSVYFHKTVRIAELMFSKAIEMVPDPKPFEFFRMTDAEIVSSLQKMGAFQQEIVTRLKYRALYKQAYSALTRDLDETSLNVIGKLEDVAYRRQKEQLLEDSFGIPHGHLIIDIPRPELLMAEPRLHKTDIFVVELDEVKTLDDFTPIAEAIRSRIIPEWVVMIITDEKYRDDVAKQAEHLLFS